MLAAAGLQGVGAEMHGSILLAWRSRFGPILVGLLLLSTARMAQAYDRVIPTPWRIESNFTPSRCSGVIRDSYWTLPDLEGAPDKPESAREEALAFANANCHDGLGACRTLDVWVSTTACMAPSDGLQYGSVYCGIRANGTYGGPPEPNDRCKGPAVPWHEDRSVSLTKFCQAVTSDGTFDAASRQCVCREGEFVPEVGRCIKPRDRFWNADCDTCFGNPIYPLFGAKLSRPMQI